MREVREFLESMGLEGYAAAFEEKGYDTLEILWLMDDEAVRSCISKPGHVLLFQNRLEAWRSNPSTWSEEEDAVSAAPVQKAAEKCLAEAGINPAALAAAETQYFDLMQLPAHWLVFIVLGLIIGTGLHCWVYCHLTGADVQSSGFFASEALETLESVEKVMESLHQSMSESEALAAANEKDSPLMQLLAKLREREGVQVDDSVHVGAAMNSPDPYWSKVLRCPSVLLGSASEACA
mmetsp:Transcript_47135/g.86494  ORF Transcript_47135/g.86494 Transcript_47135/m.86494 type:complete len:236 (+) Transcript_47135:112-819(+)